MVCRNQTRFSTGSFVFFTELMSNSIKTESRSWKWVSTLWFQRKLNSFKKLTGGEWNPDHTDSPRRPFFLQNSREPDRAPGRAPPMKATSRRLPWASGPWHTAPTPPWIQTGEQRHTVGQTTGGGGGGGSRDLEAVIYHQAVSHPLWHQDVHFLRQLDVLASALEHGHHLFTAILLHQPSGVLRHGARLHSINLRPHPPPLLVIAQKVNMWVQISVLH